MHDMKIRGRTRLRLLACGALLALGSTSASAEIYATAFDGVNVNFFFSLTPNGAGADAGHFGHVLQGPVGPDEDALPLTAMAGINGQLKATSVAKSGSFDYYSGLAVQPDGTGGYTFNNGGVSELENGAPLSEPVGSMAALGGVMLATSWTGTRNYFFELHDNSSTNGAFGNNFGGVTLGEGGRPFGYEIETMASFGGQLYGTAYDGTNSLFFRINRNADGAGAWIDGLGFLEVSGGPDTDRVDAMVGGADGLYASSWNDIGQYNYFFRIKPKADGFGGFETETGKAMLDGANIPFRINALGYVPSSAPSVPEPASWAMLIAGFGFAGFALRRRPVHSGAMACLSC